MFFDMARNALFMLPAETAHELTLRTLAFAGASGILPGCTADLPSKPVSAFGIQFPNPVGLAAGLDKNGECINAFAKLGFGFIEVGTVTPRPQPGNPRPRLFRIPERQAIINRMGFNNHGVDVLVGNVRRSRYKGVLGINIGKNKDTPNESALEDYRYCLRAVHEVASYVTVNVSSPNTPGLRTLQHGDALRFLLEGLSREQDLLAKASGRRVPMLLKISPDSTVPEISAMAEVIREFRVDGVIATNTTSGRTGMDGLRHADETGGLSGSPLTLLSRSVVAQLSHDLDGKVPIIGVGGIGSAGDALAMRQAGAALVQVYTGFIYRGPQLVREIAEAW